MGRRWMSREPIGKDDTKESLVYDLYRDWLYRMKIWNNFLDVEVGCVCWMYRGPIGKDDTKESAIWVFYRDWPCRRKLLPNIGAKPCGVAVRPRTCLRDMALVLRWRSDVSSYSCGAS